MWCLLNWMAIQFANNNIFLYFLLQAIFPKVWAEHFRQNKLHVSRCSEACSLAAWDPVKHRQGPASQLHPLSLPQAPWE